MKWVSRQDSQKLAVVIIANSYLLYTVELVNGLTKAGCEVQLVLLSSDLPNWVGKKPTELLDKTVNLKVFKIFMSNKNKIALPTLILNPVNFFQTIRIIKLIFQNRANVIHFQGAHLVFLPIALFCRSFKSTVDTVHDPILHIGERTLIGQFIHNTLIKLSRGIFLHGELMASAVKKLNPKTIIEIVPHGSPWSILQIRYPPQKFSDADVLLFGRLISYKGLKGFLNCINLVVKKRPSTKFIVAGRSFGVESDLAELEHNSQVVLINRFVPLEELPTLFESVKLVVLPYIDASYSGVVPLAFMFGKPVVVTNVGGLREQVSNGTTGFLVPSNKPQEIADAIVKILENDCLRKQISENAYRKASTALSTDTIAASSITAYLDIIRHS